MPAIEKKLKLGSGFDALRLRGTSAAATAAFGALGLALGNEADAASTNLPLFANESDEQPLSTGGVEYLTIDNVTTTHSHPPIWGEFRRA